MMGDLSGTLALLAEESFKPRARMEALDRDLARLPALLVFLGVAFEAEALEVGAAAMPWDEVGGKADMLLVMESGISNLDIVGEEGQVEVADRGIVS